MDKISPMDIFQGIRNGIKEMIKQDPDATAKDVLNMLELTQEMVALMEKRLSQKP